MMQDFVRKEILSGLQLLYSLRLEGAPPEDTVEATARAWMIALGPRTAVWTPDEDGGRLTKAFVLLAGSTKRWPGPAALMTHIAERIPAKPACLGKRLTPEEKEKGRERLKKIYRTIQEKTNPERK